MTREETLKINQEEAKSPNKRVDGTVLGVIGNDFASHKIGEYNVAVTVKGEVNEIALSEVLNNIYLELQNEEMKIKILKEVIENLNERLAEIERKMKVYGFE